MFYANIGSAAGPRGGCQNFIASAPISSDQFEIKIPTCLNYTIPLPLIYFGVVQNSFTAAYTIRVEEEDQLELGNIENTRLTLGSPLTTRVCDEFLCFVIFYFILF